jgi:hypothetical protein
VIFLIIDALKISKTLEFVEDTHQFTVARMKLLHLELLSLEPVSTEEAIDFELGARILQMLLNSFKSLD